MFAGWGRFVYRFRWATLAASGVLLATPCVFASEDALDELNAVRAARGLRPYVRDDYLTAGAKNVADFRAKYLIEDFMIAANGVTAGYLEAKGLPSVRRVLRTALRVRISIGQTQANATITISIR